MSNLSTGKQVSGWLAHPVMRERIGNALGGFMSDDMFLSQAALAAQDEKIANCSPESVFSAMLQVATMGLLPGAHHGHVALIPRGGKLNVQVQWQGRKFLLERQSHVHSVDAHLVHETDDIEVQAQRVVRRTRPQRQKLAQRLELPLSHSGAP